MLLTCRPGGACHGPARSYVQATPRAGRRVSQDETSLGLASLPAADESRPSLVRIVGPSGALDVWLGGAGDHSALEAEVRDVSAQGTGRLPALAIALGDVATRHKLEVRVIPRMDADGPRVLVLFGSRTHRAK